MSDKKTILVVDDDQNILIDLKVLLEYQNYNVIIANNGQIGLQQALNHLPDLILSDISMPVMNGFEFLEKLKETKAANTPFIFVTAKGQYDALRKGMEFGADDYIYKPYDVNELLKAISTRLSKSVNIEKEIDLRFKDQRDNIKKAIPHEIRTPLTVIINNTGKLLSQDLDQDQKDLVNEINIETNRLNKLLDKYITLTNIEMLGIEDVEKLRTKDTYIPSSIVKSLCDSKFHNQDREFRLFIEDEINSIKIDQNHFQIVVSELIDNAIKFSEGKSVIKISTSNQQDKFNLSIENRGTPFPEEKLNLIDEYNQFNRDQHEQQGLGLGLAIVKKVIDLYNGSFSINTNENDSTTVSIIL